MAANWRRHFLFDFLVLCLINGAFSAIVEGPKNTLLVRCEDEYANMTCRSDTQGEIAWTYDGNPIINSPCEVVTYVAGDVFMANPISPEECGVVGILSQARADPTLNTISGPYGCTDRSNRGLTNISLVILLDMWCGVVNKCPAREGDDVTVGCYAQYDWLSYWLQYNPVVPLNASIQFLEYPTSLHAPPGTTIPPATSFPPPSERLMTTHTIRNVQVGDKIEATCRVNFVFGTTAYSGRNVYAHNSLEYSCVLEQAVYYCPKNVKVEPADACQAGTILTCTADSSPDATYIWIDHMNNDAMTVGPTFTLAAGEYRVTCVAISDASCTQQNEICRDPGSLAAKSTDPNFPFNLFNFTAIDYTASESCRANTTVSGFAIECPFMTFEAQGGCNKCNNDTYLVLLEPTTVRFTCEYEGQAQTTTTYAWYLDGAKLGFTSTQADIAITSGSHVVQCEASIENVGGATPNVDCTCRATGTMPTVVVECLDSMTTISPPKTCVKGSNTFSCSSTSGHPPPASYIWTNLDTSVSTAGPDYNLTDVEIYNLSCKATYAPSYCPECWAACYVNSTIRVFKCPDSITASAVSAFECPKTTCVSDELIITQPSVVDFTCLYDNPPSVTKYTWYLGTAVQAATTSTASISIPSGTHTVKCVATIDDADDCDCYESHTFTVTVVECASPTIQPADNCVQVGTTYYVSATTGHPGTPTYELTYARVGATPVTSAVSSYTANDAGNFSMYWSATYQHATCPECKAVCYANLTGVVFNCPTISVTGTSAEMCPTQCQADELILMQPSIVQFTCNYVDPLTVSKYKWYADGSELTGETSATTSISIASGTHTVTCEALIEKAKDCECKDSYTITAIVVECSNASIQPPIPCIKKGDNMTCVGYGHPTVKYSLSYTPQSGVLATYDDKQVMMVNDVGNFSLSCEADYYAPNCAACIAKCMAKHIGSAFDCPENLTLSHNGSVSTATYLFFNTTTTVSFLCHFGTQYSSITMYKWVVNGVTEQISSKEFYYDFGDGDFTVTCMAWFSPPSCPNCSRSATVTVEVKIPSCPNPHWPPIYPPIIALLLSILMMLCYCKSCGPWSGPYWCEQRKRMAMEERYRVESSRPTGTVVLVGRDDGVRFRPTNPCNGYGRL